MVWRTALLSSLLLGTRLGSATVTTLAHPERLDPLADELGDDIGLLQSGLEQRLQHIETGRADLALTRETMDLFVPLADRMGLPGYRAQLEDAGFLVLDPDAHASLSAGIAPAGLDDAALLDSLLAQTRALLAPTGLDATITGRTKSLYSTWRKMERKGVALDEIMDRVALRVQVDEIADCYTVLDLLHHAWTPLPGSFDDYIANPKPNGYRSIHTAVRTASTTEPVEFQVRTRDMHAFAEGGDAAHWRYKLAGSAPA